MGDRVAPVAAEAPVHQGRARVRTPVPEHASETPLQPKPYFVAKLEREEVRSRMARDTKPLLGPLQLLAEHLGDALGGSSIHGPRNVVHMAERASEGRRFLGWRLETPRRGTKLPGCVPGAT